LTHSMHYAREQAQTPMSVQMDNEPDSRPVIREGEPNSTAVRDSEPGPSASHPAKPHPPDTQASDPSPPLGGQRLTDDIRPARAALDVGIQIVGRVGNLALGVLATAVLARSLGDYRFGQWSTLLLIPALLAPLNELGFLQVAVRHASRDDDPRWLGALISARAALSIPVTVLTILAVTVFAHGSSMLLAGIIVALQGLLAAPMAMVSVFQVKIRNDLAIIALTFNSVLWTAAVIAIALSGGSLVPYAVALTGTAVLSAAVQAAIAHRTVRVPLRGTRTLWGRLSREAVPLSIGSILIVAYGRIDGLIVYSAAGTSAAGLYNAIYRFVEQIGVVPLSLVVTLTPIAARIVSTRPAQARGLLQLALDLLAMFSLLALAFSIAVPDQIISFLYGASFDAAAPALPVLMGAFVVICCGYVLGMFTLTLGLQREFARFAVVALVFNVAANLLLVPRYGFRAAAWTTLLTEVLVAGLIGRVIFKRMQMRLSLGRIGRAAIAAALAGGVTFALSLANLNVLLLLLAACLVDMAGLFALRALSVREIRAILRRDPIGAL
jgi:O-antigen/teichoic acid export membrane protein